MRTLLFLNPEIQEGLNLTVRNGFKWLGNSTFETLRVAKTGEEDTTLGHVEVITTIPIHKDELERYEHLLRYEHDPSCRTVFGLRGAMDRAYPDGWGPSLTLLFFVPVIKS